MKSDAQLIEAARRDGVPSIGYARELEVQRRSYFKAINSEQRDEALAAFNDAQRRAHAVARWRWPITAANVLFSIVAVASYVAAITYGYRALVAPAFGLPNVSPVDVFLAVFLVKYTWKGLASATMIEKREEEHLADKNRLWLDNVKREARANAHNIGGAAMVATVFYLFTLFG